LHPIAGKEPVAARIITEHNIVFMMTLMSKVREAIKEERFEDFVCNFLERMFEESKPPAWVRECLVSGAGLTKVESLFRWDDRALPEGSDNPHVLGSNLV
jgi:queuine tRNA-ribosyltransferase